MYAEGLLQGLVIGAIAAGVILSLYLCFKFSILTTDYAYTLSCNQHRGLMPLSRADLTGIVKKVKKLKWLAVVVVLATGWLILPLPFYFMTYTRIAQKMNGLCPLDQILQ